MSVILGNILIIIGMVFIIAGALFVLILPDMYARLLACANIDTMGMFFVIIGLLLINPLDTVTVKKVIILIFTLLINPISSYTIGRSAYLRGERPKTKEGGNYE
ncbi:multicomponent Na+:H+ antiporter subunit G [Natranaerovirga hydrolytica]|uniref:Multicomponent Na+:H+ antiporter subunit G n=1 Tax=Natranaerovirga hydrolytica TaxID=680378 RepID=A0A4R1N0Z8_9FIRM|nr:monovalent cation/H(+) antiporter subunit G [Natranaerovirga hydrolytica]TCK98582.1 multicomponent Na+:H+ antiporter subunit G [Natranaerovirga hydrolytica]